MLCTRILFQTDSPSNLSTTSIFDLPIMSYVVLVVLMASTFQNMFTLATLLGMRKGIGRTTRSLFIALALTDLYNMFVWYGVAAFAKYGLYFLTGGSFYFLDISHNIIACKSLPAMGYLGIFCSHWLYVFVNVDRLVAVLRPHRSQRSRIQQRIRKIVVLLLFISLLTSGLTALLNTVNDLSEVNGARL